MTAGARPLLLGVDRYVLRACGRRDVPAVLVYGPNWRDSGLPPLPEGITAVFTEDERSPEAVLSALSRAGLSGERFASVSTTNEFDMVNAAVLAGTLGCPGLAPEVAVRFRDKSVQKEAVRSRGIPTARWVVVDDIFDVALAELPFSQCVLKPIMGAATRRTTTLRSISDLQEASRTYRSQGGPSRTFVIEEFQDGAEWLVDGVVCGGEVVFCSVAEYAQPCLRTIEAQVPLQIRRFDPATERWAFELAEPIVHAALTALGLADGIFHMELFHADGTVVFSECAARRGGALVHEQIECKFGVDLGDAAFLLALGEKPEVTDTGRPGVVGSTYIPAPEGLLFSAPLPEEVMALPDVEFVLMAHPIGASLPPAITDTTTRIGQVMLRTATADRFYERSNEIIAWFAQRIKVVPPGLKIKELKALQQYLGHSDAPLNTYSRKDPS